MFSKLMRPLLVFLSGFLWCEARKGRRLLEKHWTRLSCGARLPSAPTRTGDVIMNSPASLSAKPLAENKITLGKFELQNTRVHNKLNYEVFTYLFNGLK